AMVAAACDIEIVVLGSVGPRAPNMDGVDDSAARAIRSIIVTASTGYSPTAVSADSITASVPSRIAFATSEVSARVGRGLCTMDSSIWVAMITGIPAALAF